MGTFLDTVRHYFDEKNKVWLTGDLEGLRKAAHAEPSKSWWKRNGANIERKRQATHWRRGVLLRSHTKVHVRKLLQDEGSTASKALIDEHVTWVYRDNPGYAVEARVISHLQRWRLEGGVWKLEKDLESDELQRIPVSDADTLAEPMPVMVSKPNFQPSSFRDAKPGQVRAYDRVRALRYSELWWSGFNPVYPKLDEDCTNFISQCLFAGNVPMTHTQSRAEGWWYRFTEGKKAENWSYSWTTSHALYLHLTNHLGATRVSSARDLKVGDLVFYDWGGQGTFHHTAFVADFDNRGDALVNAHTDPSWHRHYLYLDSRAWTARTRYAFVRMPDRMPDRMDG